MNIQDDNWKFRVSLIKFLFYVITLGYALISIFPFLWSLYASFRPALDVYKFNLDFSNLSINNYIDIAKSDPIGKWYLNSIVVAVIVTVGNVYINAMAGYALARLDFPGKNIYFLVILGIMMIPTQVTMVPMFILLTHLGWINTFAGLTIPFLFSSFNTFLMRQFFLSIPSSIEEAAEIDGLSRLKIFFKIAMPLAKAPIITLVILTFMGNWNSFLWPNLLSSTPEMYTLPVGLATLQGEHVSFPNQIMAGAMFLTIPMIIVYMIFQKHFIEGVASTGSKE